ncbi:MAG: hypothetical protein UV28_C0008G0013 [Candidatus Collierbacteria bacterium GW2011_GWE2_42_48]|nr:MAG: hypothetical protein UV28_C0008G0013 [Candidatus Collierbacteria bacterium GW2011_GWE2_42_48]
MHKDKNTREINVINKSLRLMMDDDLINLLDKQRKKLEKNAGEVTPSFKNDSIFAITVLLRQKNVPLVWVEPLYNTILSPSVDLPLADGIHIDIEGEVLTEKTKNIYTNPDLFNEGDIPRSYNIVITRDISKEDLINFVEDNQFLLSNIQKALRLPEDPPVRSKNTLYGLAVIRLRDERGLSFEEIATFITDSINKDETISDEEKSKMLGMVSTGDSVRKNIYDRFKKNYLRLKNSPKK